MKKIIEQKQQVVDNLKEKFQKANLAIFTDYRGEEKGLTVAEVNELRKNLRNQKGEFKVVKNTLIRRALDELAITGLEEQLFNPTAIVFSYQDPVTIAKTLVDFAKKRKTVTSVHGLPGIKIGYLLGTILDPRRIRELATLPGREVLLARLLGTMQAPITRLVRVLTEPIAKLVRILPQIKTQ